MDYSHTSRDGEESLVLFTSTGDARTVASTHPRFADILQMLTDGADEAAVLRSVEVGRTAGQAMTRLSERVSYTDGSIFFDGDKLDTAMSRHLVRMIAAGDDNWPGMVKFMENLAQNPSRASRMQLWRWLNERDFAITDNGTFIAYKGVQDVPENLSVAHGRNVVFVDGEPHTGNIPNPVGATVEMARAEVNDDREVGCSEGLHAGTYSYASSFGRKVLIVEIYPRDVVSVPRDCEYQKLRTCRYVVTEERALPVPDTRYAAPIYGRPLFDSDDEDVCDDCGNHIDDCACDDECSGCGRDTDDCYCG